VRGDAQDVVAHAHRLLGLDAGALLLVIEARAVERLRAQVRQHAHNCSGDRRVQRERKY